MLSIGLSALLARLLLSSCPGREDSRAFPNGPGEAGFPRSRGAVWPVFQSLLERSPRPAPRLGQMAGLDGSASQGFDSHPEGNDPHILGRMLPVPCPSPDAQTPEPRGEARGGTPQGAWSGEAGPKTPGSAEAGCVLTQHARPWGRRPGGQRRRGAWSRGQPWPRPWPIFTTPTWATSITVREQGGMPGVPGRGGFEARATTPGLRTDELSFPTPRGWAPYEAPSLGTDS